MIRIVATQTFRDIIIERAGGDKTNPSETLVAQLAREMRHGEVRFTYRTPEERNAQGTVTKAAGSPITTYDVLVDAVTADMTRAEINALKNRPDILYMVEWDPSGPTHTTDAQGNKVPAWVVLKGTDPGYHRFAGWPV